MYERIPWPEYEYVLYQGLAVEGDSWLIFWFYCQSQELRWVYYEGTHGIPLRVEAASGTCRDVTAQTINILLDETNMTLPPDQTVHRIQGTNIQYDGDDGWLLMDGTNWTFVPFQTIDCSTDCGGSGWYELHVVLWNETKNEAGFGILYLRSWSPSQVTLEYGLMLPTLDRFGASFEAAWS